jgi:hypothetical protein
MRRWEAELAVDEDLCRRAASSTVLGLRCPGPLHVGALVPPPLAAAGRELRPFDQLLGLGCEACRWA